MTYIRNWNRPRVAQGWFSIYSVSRNACSSPLEKRKKEEKKRERKRSANNSIRPIKTGGGGDSWRFATRVREAGRQRKRDRGMIKRGQEIEWALTREPPWQRGWGIPAYCRQHRVKFHACVRGRIRWSACRKVHYITTLGVATFPSHAPAGSLLNYGPTDICLSTA